MTKSLCIVTEEYSGLNKSGGIGAASRGLAEAMALAGYEVELLITDVSLNAQTASSRATLQKANLRFTFLQQIAEEATGIVAPTDYISRAYHVYNYLKEKDFSVVHFNDWLGSGFYCAMARRQGQFKSYIITNLHGGSEWVRHHNEHLPDIGNFELEAIEHSQIENSDMVVSPSAYLLDWYESRALRLPKRKVQSWVLPQWLSLAASKRAELLRSAPLPAGVMTELIFFGRHERRKGFDYFVDALRLLPDGIHPDVTFIGRFDRVDNEFSGSRAARKLSSYPSRIRFFNSFNQEEALSYIKRAKNALCVMPSVIENSPCVVGECFTIGVPFLATDVGGTDELVSLDSRKHCLVALDAKSLADAIVRATEEGIPPLISRLSVDRIVQEWQDLHNEIETDTSDNRSAERVVEQPLVSVCVTHYERPSLLKRAVAALLNQTYQNFEIVVVDDGSQGAEAKSYLSELEVADYRVPVRVLRSTNRYLGAARNLAASMAAGDYLIFHDDDNVSEPSMIETFVSGIITSGCDILTAQYFVFRDENLANKKIEYFPIGLGGPFSFFSNRFGDANAIVKAETFASLGGFTELRGVGWEDWELFLKAHIRGKKTGVVAKPLFNYRVSDDGMLATGNMRRNFERLYSMIDAENPALQSDLMRYMQRDFLSSAVTQRTWYDLSRMPQADLHHRMTSVDPNSEEARELLCELLLSMGRVQDAVEFGLQGSWDLREKYVALAAVYFSRQPLSLRGMAYQAVDNGAGAAIKLVRGWGVTKQRQRFVPERLQIGGRNFKRINYIPEARSDVLQHLKATGSGLDLGFIMTMSDDEDERRANPLLRKMKRISAPGHVMMATGSLLGGRCVIDNLIDYRDVKIALPELFTGAVLRVETSVPSYVFVGDGRDWHSDGTGLKTRHVFRNIPHESGAELRLLVPAEGKVGVIIE